MNKSIILLVLVAGFLLLKVNAQTIRINNKITHQKDVYDVSEIRCIKFKNVDCGNTNLPPQITKQPVDVTICEAGAAEFSVTATSAETLSYQWYKLDTGSWTLKTGATTTNYQLPTTNYSDAGDYRCIVSDINGSATSNTATLTVVSPPALTAAANTVAGEYTVCPRGGALSLNMSAKPNGGVSCGKWLYNWYNGSKYWDGNGFNSLMPIDSEQYKDITFTGSDSVDYTVRVKCSLYADSSSYCSNNSSILAIILKDVIFVNSEIGTPANGGEHHMNVTWSKVNGGNYKLQYSKDKKNWYSLPSSPYSLQYDHNMGDYPNGPVFYHVQTYLGSDSCGDWVTQLDTAFTACDYPVLAVVGSTGKEIYLALQNDNNPPYTLYSIKCQTTGQFLQDDGTLGNNEVYRTRYQWGHSLQTSDSITVKGLIADSNYCFYALAKNRREDVRTQGPQKIVCQNTLIVNVFNINHSTFNILVHPNPFSQMSVVSYHLPENCKVEISVYNLFGNKIFTLVNEYKTAGEYKTVFNANVISAGVYFYRMEAGGKTEIGKMVVIK